MRSVFCSLVFSFICVIANAQIVISEIMYNPPESGIDSLEYIELWNTGDEAVNLEGYVFVNGVDYTFPDIELAPDAFLVIAVDSAALERQLGISARQWTSGALNNNGERIAIEDNLGNLVDEVEYSDRGDWPGALDGTDGEGASIELCEAELDNFLGTSWRAANNELGVVINGRQVKGTPGAPNTVRCLPPHDHYIEVRNNFFSPSDITVNQGETVLWENVSGGIHNVNGSQTTFPSNPESFGSGAPSGVKWTYSYTFNELGTNNYHCDPHESFGMVGTVTVREDNRFPEVNIGALRSVDNDGVADSLGNSYTIEGVVHGPNFHGNGMQFTIIDDLRDGIELFNGNDDLGYTPVLGDRIKVTGTVNQYFGLLQFDALTIELVSSRNPIFDPRVVTALDESTESDLIRIENLQLVDPNTWGMGTTNGFNVLATNGTDTFLIRVDDLSELFVENGPGSQPFNLTGLGGQFDPSTPLTDGYQIWPRYNEDLDIIVNVKNASSVGLNVYPNPASNYLTITTHSHISDIELFDIYGRSVRRFSGLSDRLALGDIRSGMYFLVINTNDGIATKAIIIQSE
jgi:plastocyanin